MCSIFLHISVFSLLSYISVFKFESFLFVDLRISARPSSCAYYNGTLQIPARTLKLRELQWHHFPISSLFRELYLQEGDDLIEVVVLALA